MGHIALSIAQFAMDKCTVKIVEWFFFFFEVTDLTQRGINSGTFKIFTCKSEEHGSWVG